MPWPWPQSGGHWLRSWGRDLSARHWRELHDGPLIAWVRFGGGGELASTLQRTFLRRASRHLGKPTPLCRTRDEDAAAEPSRPPCSDEPDLAIIQAELPYCESLSGQRPCKYFTALRDPVAKLVSQYSANCLQCAFDGLECDAMWEEGLDDQPENPDLQPVPPPSCPNMSFLDYARFKGNEYVAEFSGKKIFCARTGAAKNSSLYRECITEISYIDYEAALKKLRSSSVIAIAPEEGSLDLSMHPGWQFLQDDLRENLTLARMTAPSQSESIYVPTDEELQQLEEGLQHDIRLYNDVKAL